MKVDFIIGRLGKGGAERVMVTLANYFVKKEHDVRIITFDDYPDGYLISDKIKRIRILRKKLRTKKLDNLYGLASFYKPRDKRPEMVISFLTFTNLISILACKYRKIPIIVSEHNNHNFMLNPKWLVRLTWNYVYRWSNFVTVLTDFDVDFFQKKKSRVVVMPNPCSFPPITSNTHKREKIILAVGSLNRIHHKGLDNLIEIMSEVLPKHPTWRLKIVGGGSSENQEILENLIKKNKVDHLVTLEGFSDNITQIMSNSSIYILSSRFEGLPMVLLEAMSQGMACVSYDCITGPSNMIKNRVNGILVADQKKKEMAIACENLILDRDLRQELGNKAIKSLNNYKIEHIYEKWQVLIKQLEGEAF